MKKVLLALLALTFIFVIGCSIAEDAFTIRNGVKFGMSKAEVEAIETNNLAQAIVDGASETFAPVKLVVRVDAIDDLAGYDYIGGNSTNPEIDYCFSNNDKLVRIIYSLDSRCSTDDSDSWNQVESQYNELANLYSGRYTLIADSADSVIEFTQPVPSLLVSSHIELKRKGITEDGTLHQFKQFLAKDGEDYVEIWLYLWSNKTWDRTTLMPEIDVEFTPVNRKEAAQYFTDSIQDSTQSSNETSTSTDEIHTVSPNTTLMMFEGSSAQKMIESDVSRATATFCFVLDLAIETQGSENLLEPIFYNKSFVGIQQGVVISYYILCDSQLYAGTYTPSTPEILWKKIDRLDLTDEDVELFIKNQNDEYFENTQAAIYVASELLKEPLGMK